MSESTNCKTVALALSLSLLLHLAPGLGLFASVFGPRLLAPLPITWEVLPARRPTPPPLVPPTPTPQHKVPAPRARTVREVVPPGPKTPGPGQVARKSVARKTPPQLVKLDGIGDAAIEQDLGLRLTLRLSDIAQSTHRQAVVRLLGAFPDSRLLAAGTDVSSGEALAEALLAAGHQLVVATTDPSGLSRSHVALAVVGPGVGPLYQRLRLRPAPAWPVWDDRELSFFAPDLLVFGKRSFAPTTDATDTVDETSARRTQFAALRKTLPKQAGAVAAEWFNLQGRLRLAGGVPTPRYAQFSATQDDAPLVAGRMVLHSKADAEAFRVALIGLADRLADDWRFKMLGIATLLAHLSFEVKDNEVHAKGHVPAAAVVSLLGLAQNALALLPSGAPELPPKTPAISSPSPSPDLGSPTPR